MSADGNDALVYGTIVKDTEPVLDRARPTPLKAERGDRAPFVNLTKERKEWLERECREIKQWMADQTGIQPDIVELSPAWLGEDKRVGVLVFRVSVNVGPDDNRPPVKDWWVVREESGSRSLYPCLLTTAGDAVKYHRQVRSVQLGT